MAGIRDVVAQALAGNVAQPQAATPPAQGQDGRPAFMAVRRPEAAAIPATPPLPITPEFGRQRALEAVAQAMAAPSGARIQDQLAGTRRFWEG